MNNRHTARTLRIALITAAAALAAGSALARDVMPDAATQVRVGESRTEVQAQFGEPLKAESYLFAPGSATYYYIEGGSLGNEHLLRVAFDAQGRATGTQVVDATTHGENRYE